MKKKALLAVLLAMTLLLSSCALIVKDKEVDAKTVILKMGDKEITKAEVQEAVDDKLYEMCLVAVQRCDFVEFKELSVNADLRVTSLAHLLQELLVMSLASSHQRRKKIALAVLIILQNQRDDLFVCISDHGLSGLRRICC